MSHFRSTLFLVIAALAVVQSSASFFQFHTGPRNAVEAPFGAPFGAPVGAVPNVGHQIDCPKIYDPVCCYNPRSGGYPFSVASNGCVCITQGGIPIGKACPR